MRVVPASLVSRIALWAAIATIVLMVANMALLQWIWMRPFGQLSLQSIAGRIVAIRAALELAPPAGRPALLQRLSDANSSVHDRIPLAQKPAKPMLAPRPPIERLRELAGADIEMEMADGPHGRRVMVSFDGAGGRYWIVTEVDTLEQMVPRTLLFGLALVALAAALAAGLVVRQIGRPLHEIATALARGGSELVVVPNPAGASSEIRSVVDSYNRLVRAVVAEQQARQQLLAGVSHDLRTPLARARLRAETTLPAVYSEPLIDDLDAADRIVAQFLAYVRQEQDPPLGRSAAAAATIGKTVDRYRAAQQPVSAQIEPLDLQLPDTALDRMLSNLVDNALTYGAAPVEVALRRRGTEIEIAVSDRGAGMSEPEFELAQQPFVRLSASRGELGHCGLGLAIVRHIAVRLGARLSAQCTGDGRFEVVVAFPAAAAPAIASGAVLATSS